MWFRDPEIGQQQCGRLCHHRAAAIGTQGELVGWHVVPGDGVVEKTLNRAAFSTPAMHQPMARRLKMSKISGFPWRASVPVTASIQNSTSRVTYERHANARRMNQSTAAAIDWIEWPLAGRSPR